MRVYVLCDVCQFGNYPLVDPDPDSPFPYKTEVTKVQLGHDKDGRYTVTPHVSWKYIYM
jgi:hypothetical protein